MIPEEEQHVLQLFTFVAQAGVIVCRECRHGIDNISSLRSHLRTLKHTDIRNVKISAKSIRIALLEGTKWENRTEFISGLPVCFGGNVTTPEQFRYQNASADTSTVLTRIKELPVRMGFVCTDCTCFCEKSEEMTVRHLTKEHGYSTLDAVKKVQAMVRTPIQSLGQGIKECYFPVFVPTVHELMDTAIGKNTEADFSTQNGAHMNQSCGVHYLDSEVLVDNVDPIEDFGETTFNNDCDLKEIEAELLELTRLALDHSDTNPNLETNLSKTDHAEGEKRFDMPVAESQAGNYDSNDELELLYDALRYSINPSLHSLTFENHHAEKDYYDTPLHELASDMRVSVSRMVKESNFPRTLKEIGFKYLGSVVTALCFPPSRMKKAIQKFARDSARNVGFYSHRSRDFNGPRDMQVATAETENWALGKSNTPIVKFLACMEIGSSIRDHIRLLDSEKHSEKRLNSATDLPHLISMIERQIQQNVKSYLRDAAVTTKAAPNFIRSLVVAHNKVFSTVSSRRTSGAAMRRSDRRVATDKDMEVSPDGVASVSRVNFFKVVTTDKSVNDYGDEICLLILAVTRAFLVKHFVSMISKFDKNEEIDHGDGRQYQIEVIKVCESLKETMGGLLFLDQYPHLESAIVSCLCSVGYCLHGTILPQATSPDSDVHENGFTSDRNSETPSCRQNASDIGGDCSSPCFYQSSGTKTPNIELQPPSSLSRLRYVRLHGEQLVWNHGGQTNLSSLERDAVKEKDAFEGRSLSKSDSDGVGAFSEGVIGIHWILRALLLCESSERNSSHCLFLPKFMALLSIADPVDDVKQRRFREAHQLTPTTAALAYGMKCCGVVEMCRNKQDWVSYLKPNVDGNPSTGAHFCSCTNWLMSHEQVSRCFSTSHNTATAYLVGIHNKLRECADANTDSRVRFVECVRSEHGVDRCALVDGKECSLDTLGTAVKAWQTRARNLISENLMLGMHVPDGFENMLSLLNDKFHDVGRGRSFASLDSHFSMTEKCSLAIIKHISKEKNLYHQFFGKRNGTRNKRDEHQVPHKAVRNTVLPLSVADDFENMGEKPVENQLCDVPTWGMTSPSMMHSNAKRFEQVSMREERLQEYLDDCQKLQKLLLACLHVTGGGTARSTEQIYLFKNSAESRRNVFVLQGEVAFLARYNKNESARGRSDIIARFPDLETSKLFLMYFLYIRPVEELFVRKLHGDELGEAHGLYCFADHGKPYSSQKVRAEIVKLFYQAKIPFSYLQFRHYFTGMARKHLTKELLHVMTEELSEFNRMNRIAVHPIAGFIPQTPFETVERENVPHDTAINHESAFNHPSRARIPDLSSFYPIHEQAGHTMATANRLYGVSSSDMNELGNSKLEAFRRTSRAWQRTLGLYSTYKKRKVSWDFDGCPNKNLRQNSRPGIETSFDSEGRSILVPSESILRTDVSNDVLLPTPSEKKQFQPAISEPGSYSAHRDARVHNKPQSAIHSISHVDATSVGDRIFGKNANVGLPVHIPSDRISMLLTHLRCMKRDSNATFRSLYQIYAIHLMLLRQHDLFVIMPTGYGKTDMTLLTAFIEQSREITSGKSLLTVIIVPIIALSSDLMRRCESVGIRAGTWSQQRKQVDRLTILIVSVEHVETKTFSCMISEQANKGRLARVEMEECHTTANWIDFRPAYESLKGNIRPGGIRVPVVLLSATVPPHKTIELAEKHGVTQFQELRVPTVRTNLSYVVTDIKTPKFIPVEENLCQEAIKTLKSHLALWMTDARHVGQGQVADKRACENHKQLRESGKNTKGSDGQNSRASQGGQIIMYCPTLRMRALLSNLLKDQDFGAADVSILRYDSSISSEEKSKVMREWSSFSRSELFETTKNCSSSASGMIQRPVPAERMDSVQRPCFQVVVATCGFGMGIDSPFVRSVIHLGYSRSITEYVQESGRAGRDGNVAKCEMLFSQNLIEQEFSVIANSPSEELELIRLDSRTSPNLDLMSRRRREMELTEFIQWTKNKFCCRRQTLFWYMDREKPEMCLFSNHQQTSGSCSVTANAPAYQSPGSHLSTGHRRGSFCDFCWNCDAKCSPTVSQQPSRRLNSVVLAHQDADAFHFARQVIRNNDVDSANNSRKNLSSLAEVTVNLTENISSRPAHIPEKLSSNQDDVPDRATAEKELASFKLACIELKQFCLVCIVQKGVKRTSESCEMESQVCLSSRCYRCFQSSHSAKSCELIPFRMRVTGSRKFQPKQHERRNHCYACGMDGWLRVRMHQAAEFSRVDVCPYISAFRLAAVAWDNAKWKKRIVARFDLRRITDLDSSVKALQDVMFFRWLREHDSNDMQRLHIMQVLDFIMLEYSKQDL